MEIKIVAFDSKAYPANNDIHVCRLIVLEDLTRNRVSIALKSREQVQKIIEVLTPFTRMNNDD